MADETTDGQAAAGNAQQAAQPSLNIVAQYVKDLSFENPGAPQSLRARSTAPNINIQVGVQANPLEGTEIEVELRIEARAVDGDATLFAIELVYGAVFRLANIPPENLQALTLIECPRLIFPFARQIVAEASRNGGFPPLLIDPIDFVQLYRQQVAARQAPQPQTPPAGQPN